MAGRGAKEGAGVLTTFPRLEVEGLGEALVLGLGLPVAATFAVLDAVVLGLLEGDGDVDIEPVIVGMGDPVNAGLPVIMTSTGSLLAPTDVLGDGAPVTLAVIGVSTGSLVPKEEVTDEVRDGDGEPEALADADADALVVLGLLKVLFVGALLAPMEEVTDRVADGEPEVLPDGETVAVADFELEIDALGERVPLVATASTRAALAAPQLVMMLAAGEPAGMTGRTVVSYPGQNWAAALAHPQQLARVPSASRGFAAMKVAQLDTLFTAAAQVVGANLGQEAM